MSKEWHAMMAREQELRDEIEHKAEVYPSLLQLAEQMAEALESIQHSFGPSDFERVDTALSAFREFQKENNA